jgi:peptidoglycan/LPS O-acetylase OafA/YrhL
MPELFKERSLPIQVVLVVVFPAVFGAIAGWLLGVNEIAYLVFGLVVLIGAYVAGLEHRGAAQGALRGAVLGLVYGGALLLVHEATGKEPKAELPDPEILVLAITIGFSVVAGAFGGRRRVKHEEEMANKDEDEEKGPAFSLKNLLPAELIGFAGSGILLLSLFLPWFKTDCESLDPNLPEGCNEESVYAGRVGDFNAWDTFSILDWLLLAACVAPFILAYIIARGHELSWRPGEVTMIVGMTAFALILLNGVILGKPGDAVEMGFKYGYLVALLGAFLIMAGGTLRQAQTARARKPPGVM